MNKVAIVYGTSRGNTKLIAEKIQAWFEGSRIFNANNVSAEDLKDFNFLIFGTSTSGIGYLQDDWELLLPNIKKMDYSKKKVALFGLGDSVKFSTSFAAGMSIIHNTLKDKAEFIGYTSIEGYTFESSEAAIDGHFVGLALDEDNEYENTDKRIAAWVEKLRLSLGIIDG